MLRPVRLSFLLLSFLLGAASSVAAQTNRLNWAAGSPGGAWHTQSTGVTALITEKNPDITFELFPGGGKDNPTRIQSGDSQIGIGIDFLSRAAKRGELPYSRTHDMLRTLGSTGIEQQFMIYVSADETRSLSELLQDPKVSYGVTPQATTEYLTFVRALEFYRSSPDHIAANGGRVTIGTYGDLIQAFKDGQFQVFWTAGEIPSGVARQIADGSRRVKLLAFPDDLRTHLRDRFGYGEGILKAGTYPGLQDRDLPVTTDKNLYIVSAQLPDELAYRITKTIIENRTRLQGIYPPLGSYDPGSAWNVDAVPLHPGAEKAFRDAGFKK
ncbi:TAXI family TRAP transporter solute-binding subunit [Tardiphaga sp. 866_E4_N2_1]|uniref:TAXI family TRAP transporter solute-binding subunit n=1 Tax=unclassified Tardiphaga TaxID=2631404 RepID=UPI003F28E005